MKLKVRILEDTGCLPTNLEMFFLGYELVIVDVNESADICIFGILLQDTSRLRDDEINVLISLEDMLWWWQPFYYNYKYYGNDKVSIYYYNHLDKIKINDKYLAMPILYIRLKYYEINKRIHVKKIPYSKKKFCLNITHASNLVDKLNQLGLGQVDIISDTISYNKFELYSQYKFIICLENSHGDGYITENILDVFLASSIPIYRMSPLVEKFLNEKSLISVKNVETANYELIKELANDEQKYMTMIHENKISVNYDDENYQTLLTDRIKKLKANKSSIISETIVS